MLYGSIYDMTRMAKLNVKWQQKKKETGKSEKKKEITEEEKKLKFLKEKAEEIREGNKYSSILSKIQAGGTLTDDEIEYLKSKNPEAVTEYKKIKMEKEMYKKQLEKCKTKQEIQNIKMSKIGSCMTEAKTVSVNSNISDDKKVRELKILNAILSNIKDIHFKFAKDGRYEKLPNNEIELAQKNNKIVLEKNNLGEDNKINEENEDLYCFDEAELEINRKINKIKPETRKLDVRR